MLNMKKTAIAVLALGSSAVFAGTMGPVCAPGNVTVPCESTAWDFGITALYLQPTYSGDFAYVDATATVVDGVTNVLYRDLDSDWNWGFKLEGSYHFGTGNDMNINWYHFSGDTTVAGVFGADSAYVDLDAKWDAVNVEFGQHVDFGDMKNIRFHGGVQFARIEHDLDVMFGGVLFDQVAETRFSGFGPRAGVDMSYDFGNGLGIYANTAGALLVGTSKFVEGGTPAVANLYVYGQRTAVVPELEAKLGAKYGYAMPSGNLSLDAGYMWVNYFNAQDYVDDFGTVAQTDFAVNGPYIGLKWVGNV